MSLNELVEKSELEGHLDELQPGTTLLHGQYTITRFLNNGGFGITYLAKDSLDREVVIKECFADAFCRRTNTIVSARSRAHQGELKSIIRHFIQEARSLAKLRHPNIVGVHQVFEDNDTAYMAIDFVDGKDLLEILEDPAARLSPEQIVDITHKLLAAIGYVHEHGLLHRDISPDNILLTRQGEPILIDFGAAREHVVGTGRKHSALRVVKDGYSPQEFYIAGSDQGPWSDLYALAASLYHAIKNEAPVNGQARLAAIAEQRPDPYKPLTGTVEGYPAGFLEAIDKAMNTKPSLRIQSSTEWLAMIDSPLGKKGVDGNPEAAISRLLVQTDDDDDNLDNAVAAAAAADVAAGKESGFTSLSDVDLQPAVDTPSKGRGGLMAVSALAVLAVLGFVGYGMVGSETPAPKDAEVAPPAANVETAPETAAAPVEAAEIVVADAAPVGATDASDVGLAVAAEGEEAIDITASAEAPVDTATPAAIEEPEADMAATEATAEEIVVVAPAEENVAETTADDVAIEVPADDVAIEVPAEDVVAETTSEAPAPAEAEQIAVAESAASDAEDVAAIAPEAVAPEVEAAAEPVAEPVVEGPVLEQQVTFALWDVAIPFEFSQNAVRNAQVVLITDVPADTNLAVAGDWIVPGTEIYTVNDEPFSVERPFATMVLNAMVIDPDGYARTTVRYKNVQNQRFERGLMAVPVVRRLGLADGTLLEAGMVDGKWATTVTEVVGNADEGLKVGDILVREVTSGAAFEASDAVETAMIGLTENGAETAVFDILRDGSEMTVEVALARQK